MDGGGGGGVDTLQVEDCHLIIVDNCPVSHVVGPAPIIAQDAQSLTSLATLEESYHLH